MKIRTRSYNQWFVISEKGDVLCHGNPNGLDYHSGAFDINPAEIVRVDTREEAVKHRNIWLRQLRRLGVSKSIMSKWTVRKGVICVVLDEPKRRGA